MNISAATRLVAAGLLSLLVIGCVTKRDIEEINIKLDKIDNQTIQAQRASMHLDSLISEGALADRQLRNEIATSVADLQTQIRRLQENLNDLTERIAKQKSGSTVIKDSPGATNPGGVTPSAQNTLTCDTLYDESYLLIRKGDYQKAVESFQRYLAACPQHESVDNAYFWIGECYYALEKYADAVPQFDFLLKNYKNGRNTTRAMFKLARCYQELGQKADAKKAYQRVIDEFGGTLEAEQAKERLKELR